MYEILSLPVRLVSLSDIHFPFHDRVALELALQIVEEAKPKIAILNGDIVDHYGISYYPKSPLRAAGYIYEQYVCTGLLHLLFERLRAAGAERIIYIEGNHEHREAMWRMLKAKELYGHKALRMENLYAFPEYVTYLRREDLPQPAEIFVAGGVRAGKLHILHGDMIRLHHSTINVARTLLLKTLVPMLVGHYHRVDTYLQPDYEGKLHGCWVQGCLCLPRPHYDGGRINSQGMAVVDAFSDNLFDVANIKFISTGKALTASFGGKQFSISRKFRPAGGPPPLDKMWTGEGYREDEYYFTAF